MDCIAIIPARFASTRFPGKLVASLAGKPLIQHVVEGVLRVRGIDATVVATDDERIAEAARESGADVVVSEGSFASGTDRVADVARQYSADTIVNVQGDELVLDPDGFSRALDSFRSSAFGLGTLRTPLHEPADLWDPNVVKLVVDADGRALYFSRAPLPFPRGAWPAAGADGAPDTWRAMAADAASAPPCWVHLGVYLYRREALERWAALPPSPLEKSEGLEQLRVLEAGEHMQTYLINDAVPGVNTPEDLERAEAAIAARAAHA